jgi:hypothetical protein
MRDTIMHPMQDTPTAAMRLRMGMTVTTIPVMTTPVRHKMHRTLMEIMRTTKVMVTGVVTPQRKSMTIMPAMAMALMRMVWCCLPKRSGWPALSLTPSPAAPCTRQWNFRAESGTTRRNWHT